MALLQEIQLTESDSEETECDPEGVLDEDEDEGSDSINEGSDDSVEVIEEPVGHTQKGLPKVSALQKKRDLQAIDEEESNDSDESGKCFC